MERAEGGVIEFDILKFLQGSMFKEFIFYILTLNKESIEKLRLKLQIIEFTSRAYSLFIL